MSSSATAAKVLDTTRRVFAQELVAKIAGALGAELTSWEPSVAVEWVYCNLLLNGYSIRIGASTGGVVSCNGDPFTKTGRVLADDHATILKLIQECIQRGY